MATELPTSSTRRSSGPGGDPDSDGLGNWIDTDSDNDGSPDKDEDLNLDGTVDPGETDPYDANSP